MYVILTRLFRSAADSLPPLPSTNNNSNNSLLFFPHLPFAAIIKGVEPEEFFAEPAIDLYFSIMDLAAGQSFLAIAMCNCFPGVGAVVLVDVIVDLHKY